MTKENKASKIIQEIEDYQFASDDEIKLANGYRV